MICYCILPVKKGLSLFSNVKEYARHNVQIKIALVTHWKGYFGIMVFYAFLKLKMVQFVT